MKTLLTVFFLTLALLFGWAKWQERTAVFFPTRDLMADFAGAEPDPAACQIASTLRRPSIMAMK